MIIFTIKKNLDRKIKNEQNWGKKMCLNFSQDNFFGGNLNQKGK